MGGWGRRPPPPRGGSTCGRFWVFRAWGEKFGAEGAEFYFFEYFVARFAFFKKIAKTFFFEFKKIEKCLLGKPSNDKCVRLHLVATLLAFRDKSVAKKGNYLLKK